MGGKRDPSRFSEAKGPLPLGTVVIRIRGRHPPQSEDGLVQRLQDLPVSGSLPLGAGHRAISLPAARRYAGARAITRSGLPLPSTIFRGAAIATAPVGGS